VPDAAPRPAAVAFVTTEHFALQSARAATIAESNGRATTFLGAVSGGLVALGLIATAAAVGDRGSRLRAADRAAAGLLLRRGPRADPVSAQRPRTAASRSSPTTAARRRHTAPAPSPRVVGRTLAGIPNGRGHGRLHHSRTRGLRRRIARRHRVCSLSGGCARGRRRGSRGHAGRVDAVSDIGMEALRLTPAQHRSGRRSLGILAREFLVAVRCACSGSRLARVRARAHHVHR
jgi:hypothetical protein